MTGQETFDVAAAVAGVSIGLAAIFVLSLWAVIGTWRLFHRAAEASLAATRAALSVEDMARRLTGQMTAQPCVDEGRLLELRSQMETLMAEERRLQETARDLLETASAGMGSTPVALNDLEAAVGRLDATISQMAASVANLIQALEEQRERR